MATTYSVGLEFSAKTQQLDQVVNKIQKFERDIAKLQGKNPFEGTERGARGAAGGIDRVSNSAKKAQGAIGGLRNALLTLGIGAFVKTIYSAAAGIERTKVQLKTLTGSAQEAERVFSQLQEINKQSPFELKDLTSAASRLSAFGVATNDLVATTERLGKVAAGTGQELGGIATAYGQVLAKGRLQGEELLQFQERGIDLGGELQKMLGLTKEEFSDMTSKGQISAKLVEEAIKNMTGETGRFKDAFVNTADTLDTKLSNLQDAFYMAAGALGAAFEPVFKWMIDQLTNILNLIASAISQWQGVASLTPERVGALRDQAGRDANQKFGTFNLSGNKQDFYNRQLDTYINNEIKKAVGNSQPATAASAPKPGVYTQQQQQQYRSMVGGSAPAPGGGSKGGKGDAERAAQEAQRQQARLTGLTREMQLITTIGEMKEKERLAELAGDQALVTRLQGEQKLAELQKSKADAIAQAQTAAEKAQQSALFDLKIEEQKKTNAFDLTKLESDRKERLDDLLTGFDREIELSGAKTEEAKKLLEIEHKILDLRKEGLLTTDEEIQKYRERAQAAAAAGGGGGKLQEYMNKLKTELGDTEGMIVSLAGTIEGEIGSAMSNAITGLIDGTMTAEQAFSQMFKNIGKAFIDMATQMIAKALVTKVLGIAFGGGTSGGGFGGFSGAGPVGMPGAGVGGGSSMFMPGAPSFFAEGGYVTGPTNAVIGEGGSNEYVIPENKMGSAMAKWSAGARGDAVVNGADPTGGNEGAALADQPPQINISGGIMQFGGDNYIRQDQLPGIISQASKQGEARTLRRLRQSQSTRQKVGI